MFYPENIKRNLEFTGGLVMAERLMAELTRRGMGRQTAYAAVRQCAIEASRTGRSLRDVVLERSEIMDYVTVEDLEEIMNLRPTSDQPGGSLRGSLRNQRNGFDRSGRRIFFLIPQKNLLINFLYALSP